MKILNVAVLFSTLALSGCGSSPPTQGATSAALDGVATCQSLFAREAACTDTFIPMLVDLRVKHDLPAGIRARALAPNGRAELIVMAKDEWKVDSVDPARTQTCDKMGPAIPADALAAVRTCLATTTCDALVACVAPIHEQMLR